jgi:hypothetical protein
MRGIWGAALLHEAWHLRIVQYDVSNHVESDESIH